MVVVSRCNFCGGGAFIVDTVEINTANDKPIKFLLHTCYNVECRKRFDQITKLLAPSSKG